MIREAECNNAGMTSLNPDRVAGLFADAHAGSRAALAKLLTMVERGGGDARTVGALAYPLSGNAHTVGITGAPGAGKSTLTSALVTVLRAHDISPAVLAIDPSSPFTGGAILGDRVRMQTHALDRDVFIRSMASRGQLGGLSLATPEAVRLLDALGKQVVIIETVGVGQVEVEIAGAADSTVVVVNPGWGDGVQANKAGLMEIADIFVINKADRQGVADTERDLRQMLELGSLARHDGWTPPIVLTVSTSGDGADALWTEIELHRNHLASSGLGATRRHQRLVDEVKAIAVHSFLAVIEAQISTDAAQGIVDDVVGRRIDPWAAADLIVASAASDRRGSVLS